ncbi:hypothetical protein ACHAWC_004255, partial [Mediolabrus comicus]
MGFASIVLLFLLVVANTRSSSSFSFVASSLLVRGIVTKEEEVFCRFTDSPIQRFEWFRVAGGLFDSNFWVCNNDPNGLVSGWYVKRLRQAIEEMHQKSGGEKCILLCHSAGGWLARACLGDGSWKGQGGESIRVTDYVRALITLGSVHKPPEGSAASSCATRGALAFTASRFPRAFLAKQGIQYISIGGNAIKVKLTDVHKTKKRSSQIPSSLRTVRSIYAAVSGRSGQLVGDGVVPLEWSLLDGSHNIVLDGVVHSIHDHGMQDSVSIWYGSETVVDRWLLDALGEIGIEANTNGKKEMRRQQSNNVTPPTIPIQLGFALSLTLVCKCFHSSYIHQLL